MLRNQGALDALLACCVELGMIQNTFELWAAVHVFASAFNDRGLESRSSLPGMIAAAQALVQAQPQLLAISEFAARAGNCMGLVCQEQVQLCFGVHLNVVIAAALYLCVKLCSIKVSFSKCVSAVQAARPAEDPVDIFQKVWVPAEIFSFDEAVPAPCDARTYYNDVFLPVMGAYDPHRLMAGVAGEETRPPSAQRVVEQTPGRAGTGKAPPGARRRPLVDISNRTPLRQLR
ncbi:hypothetical protein QBZ16_002712 [Prototheca wickerhamii]|uniref:Uncharacterized protein n=1 Tax=Prototheca wickerhamii TaxID=3111 RepID=A0AAD9MIX5_PROWI|nr:hypothetical protein QBZ16_002712 [Prototheca wickerhamii]